MKTVTKNIVEHLTSLEDRLINFLSDHSGIKRTFLPGDAIISVSGDYSFLKLSNDAVSIQDKLYKDFNKVFDIIKVLISDSPKIHIKTFDENQKTIERFILQSEMTWSKSISEAIDKSRIATKEIIKLITNLFPYSTEKTLLVVDTNSLYQLPDIECWSFSEFIKFEMIITPSVLKDLDKHKIEHRNENVRKKAIKIINKLKEYRRRGKLLDGVTVIKGKIDIRTIAIEPNFKRTLSWLDSLNEDDRLIAEFLEIMKSHGGSSVFMVTRDINLQNKCEAANLSFIEPPEET